MLWYAGRTTLGDASGVAVGDAGFCIKFKTERKSNVKKRIGALFLVWVLVLCMTVGATAAGTGQAEWSVEAEYLGGRPTVTVSLRGVNGVTNGRVTVLYDPALVTLDETQTLASCGALSVNRDTEGQVSFAWVGSNLTAEKKALFRLTFQPVAGAAQDTTYRVEPVEAYAGEEKLEASGASVTLTYNPFEDIAQHWAKEEILKAYHAGLFQGVSATRFAPESAIDRAMFVTVLYRLAGSPEVETVKTDFTDVDTGRYYAEAVAWAVETGVTNGVGEDRFAPHSAISRQDLVTMLYRYAQATGQDVTGQADLSGYVDAAGISGYAKEAMAWAVEEEILEGYPGNYLLPRRSTTRAQAAVIFCRYGQL